jgi:transcription factor MBP1
MRQAELEHLQRQADELRVRELEQTAGGTESDEDLQAQLEAVEAECVALLEAEQQRNLDALYQSPISDIPSGPPDDSLDEDALLRLQLKYAREFMDLKDERQELVKDVSGHLARAGLGEGKQQQYKRLITGALGVKEEELEGLLPEIVEELEMGKGLGV